MSRLESKVVLITGGTQSIGAACAKLFVEEGARVIISSRKENAFGISIAKMISENIDYVKLDVSEEKDWQNAMKYIEDKYKKLDVLINNAGIEMPPNNKGLQNPEDCSLADWRLVHQTNLDGVFLGCKYGIKLMKKNKNCSIVNMGSRSGLVGVPGSAAYSSSKAAIRNYTKTVAMYCAFNDYSIRCNVIQPAAILTKMWEEDLGADYENSEKIVAFSQSIPLKRMGQPTDVAYAALYLASDESLFMTGAELVLDGGIMAISSALGKAAGTD